MALTASELERVTNALGSTCTIAASGIARLYLASPDPYSSAQDPRSVLHSFPKLSNNQWTYTNVMGALVFVIDRALDTFMFQIYDLESYIVRFEYELYYDMDYRTPDKVFHSFEMEDCVAGFSFSDEGVSKVFQSKVRALAPSARDDAPVNVVRNGTLKRGMKKKGLFGSFFGSAPKTKSSEHVAQNIQIGAVTKVVHQQHIGVNMDGTLDVNNLPSEWKRFLKEGGVRKRDLKNPEMVATIRNVMEDAGVSWTEPPLDVSKEDLSQVYDAEQMRQYEEYEAQLRAYEREAAQYEAMAKQKQWEEENKATIAKAKKAKAKAPPPLPPRQNGSNASPANSISSNRKPERRPRRPQPPALPPVRNQYDRSPQRGNQREIQHKGSKSSSEGSREHYRKGSPGEYRNGSFVGSPTALQQKSSFVGNPKALQHKGSVGSGHGGPRSGHGGGRPIQHKGSQGSAGSSNQRGMPNQRGVPHKGPGHSEQRQRKPVPPARPQRAPKPQAPPRKNSASSAFNRIRKSLGRKPSNVPPAVSETKPTTHPVNSNVGAPHGFLDAIRGGGVQLKPAAARPVSVLPKLSTVEASAKDSIMAKLKEAMDARRPAIESAVDGDDDSDNDSEWSLE